MTVPNKKIYKIQHGRNATKKGLGGVATRKPHCVAATITFTCHTRRFVAATCRGDVSQRFVASCVLAFTPIEHFNKSAGHSTDGSMA